MSDEKSNDLPLVTCNPVQPVSGLDDRRVIPPPLIPPRPGMLGLEGRSTLRAMSYRSQRPSSRDNQTHCKPTLLVVAYLAVVLQFDIDDCLEQSKYLAFVNLSYCTCVCVNSTVFCTCVHYSFQVRVNSKRNHVNMPFASFKFSLISHILLYTNVSNAALDSYWKRRRFVHFVMTLYKIAVTVI